ncbi:hypothetical protein U1Q18_038300 [Sarracenia purpurea var. burkii]
MAGKNYITDLLRVYMDNVFESSKRKKKEHALHDCGSKRTALVSPLTLGRVAFAIASTFDSVRELTDSIQQTPLHRRRPKVGADDSTEVWVEWGHIGGDPVAGEKGLARVGMLSLGTGTKRRILVSAKANGRILVSAKANGRRLR